MKNIRNEVNRLQKDSLLIDYLAKSGTSLWQCMDSHMDEKSEGQDFENLEENDYIELFMNTAHYVYFFMLYNFFIIRLPKYISHNSHNGIYAHSFIEKIFNLDKKIFIPTLETYFKSKECSIESIFSLYHKLPAVQYIFARNRKQKNCRQELATSLFEILTTLHPKQGKYSFYRIFIETPCEHDKTSFDPKKVQMNSQIKEIVTHSIQQEKERILQKYYFPYLVCPHGTSRNSKLMSKYLAFNIFFSMISYILYTLVKKNEKCFLKENKSYNSIMDKLNKSFTPKENIDQYLLFKDKNNIKNEKIQAQNTLQEFLDILSPPSEKGSIKFIWNKTQNKTQKKTQKKTYAKSSIYRNALALIEATYKQTAKQHKRNISATI